MSATLSKLRISWVGRALLAYAVSALALVVLGLAAPGSAVFFPPVSLWCNLALFGLVLAVLASFWGALGIGLGLGWICCHLASLEPLGVPWLAPFAPDTPRAACDTTRVPVRRAKLREVFLRPEDRRNQR